jgi:hypothetical protein
VGEPGQADCSRQRRDAARPLARTATAPIAEAADAIENLTPAQGAAELHRPGILLVDVRERDAMFRDGTIDGVAVRRRQLIGTIVAARLAIRPDAGGITAAAAREHSTPRALTAPAERLPRATIAHEPLRAKPRRRSRDARIQSTAAGGVRHCADRQPAGMTPRHPQRVRRRALHDRPLDTCLMTTDRADRRVVDAAIGAIFAAASGRQVRRAPVGIGGARPRSAARTDRAAAAAEAPPSFVVG